MISTPKIIRSNINALRLLSLTILIAAHWNCTSQIKFFINPQFNFKNSIAFVDPTSPNFNNGNTLLENQYFYAPYVVAYSARIIKHPVFSYGLGIGMTYKNDNRRVQFSWSHDGAFWRVHSLARPYYSADHGAGGINYMGVKINRFTLNYLHKLSKKESIVQSWLSIGVGSFVNKNRWTGIFPAAFDMVVSPNGDRLLQSYLQPLEESKVNGHIKLGIENDIFIKKKYFFSFNAYYIQGFGVISRSEYIHEYLINNEIVQSKTGLMSRGSGFYFEISRRINFYNWDRKKN